MTTKSLRITSLFLITAVSLCGRTFLVDFGSSTSFRGVSPASPDANGNYWNSFKPGDFLSGITDTAGTNSTLALGIDLSSAAVGTDSFNGPAGATSDPVTPSEIAAVDIDTAALGSLATKEAAIDFITVTSGGQGRLQIQGLDPSKTYNLELFASRRFQDNPVTLYQIYSNDTYTTSVASVTLQVQNSSMPWQNNRDVVATFTGLSPQASNILYLTFQGQGGAGSGSLNALRLTEVASIPEPAASSLLIGVLATCAFALRRRRML